MILILLQSLSQIHVTLRCLYNLKQTYISTYDKRFSLKKGTISLRILMVFYKTRISSFSISPGYQDLKNLKDLAYLLLEMLLAKGKKKKRSSL